MWLQLQWHILCGCWWETSAGLASEACKATFDPYIMEGGGMSNNGCKTTFLKLFGEVMLAQAPLHILLGK